MSGRRWTEREISTLRVRWGEPLYRIAEALGRSELACYGKACEIGCFVKRTKTPLVEAREILEFVRGRVRVSTVDVRSKYGVSTGQAWQYLSRLERRGLVKKVALERNGPGLPWVIWGAV